MATLNGWIEEMADGEPVEGVVLGEMGWGDHNSENVPNYQEQPRGVVLTWEQALPWISYEFNDGFGSPKCNAVTAWTASWVIGVSTYDGSTSPFCLARNPVAHMPDMPGGG